MCFHFVADATAKELEEFYQKHISDDERNYKIFHHANGFDFPELPVVTPEDIRLMQWGLVPYYIKTSEEANKIMALTLNARSETIFEKPSFCGSIFKKRCIIPASGWFEWRHEGKEKIPFRISSKTTRLMSFGCIWSRVKLEDTGEVIESFSILTTAANVMMSIIHNNKKRMPLIIPNNLIDAWLEPNLTKQEIKSLMQPYDDDLLQAQTVSKLITKGFEDSNCPEVSDPMEYPILTSRDFMDGIHYKKADKLL
jgi:putative SOS response-associated peptidase YedK